MRRGLATSILGLSLMLASLAWSGFVLTRTVLDPGRSERLAEQVFDNEVLRAALVDRLADSMEAALPSEVAVPRQGIEEAASIALDDPAVENLVRSGIVDVHRSALEGNAEPVTIDAAALGSASRDALVGARPELDLLLPASPTLEVELPVGGLSILGTLRDRVQQATQILAVIAIIGSSLALGIAKNRSAVLRRMAYWGFGAALFWLVVGYGIPFLAETLAPSSLAIVAAFIDVFFGAMIRPALVMAAIAAALLGGSFLLETIEAGRGARALQPAARRPAAAPPGPTAPRRTVGRSESNVRRAAQSPRSAPPAGVPPTTAPPANAPPAAPPATVRADPTTASPTQMMPTPQQATPPTANPPAPRPQPKAAPTWLPGVGYLDEDGNPIDPSAPLDT